MALKPLKPIKPPKVPKVPSYTPPGQARMALKAPAVQKPQATPTYNWAGAAKVNWFPGMQPGSLQGAFQPFLGGGYTAPTQRAPDYAAGGAGLIGGDWEVQDAEAQMGAQMARARGDFQSGLRQQLIDLGLSDTSQLGSLGQYIDKDTIQKAVENKYSATAQIGQQAERARAVNNASLAARGILSSGQTTKSQQDVSASAEQGRYNALRDFLSGGAEGLRGLGDLEFQMAQGVAQARQAAAMRAASTYPEQFLYGQEDYGNTWFAPEQQAGLGNVPFFPSISNPGALQSALSPNAIRKAIGQIRWR